MDSPIVNWNITTILDGTLDHFLAQNNEKRLALKLGEFDAKERVLTVLTKNSFSTKEKRITYVILLRWRPQGGLLSAIHGLHSICTSMCFVAPLASTFFCKSRK